MFFFSSRRRHTRCALVTGVQTCALPIFGDGGVKRGLAVRELILDRARAALGKERPAVELEQFLLGQAPHHVFGIGIMDAVAESPLKAITDRKSVGSGQSVSVRVDLGGRRILQNTKKKIENYE